VSHRLKINETDTDNSINNHEKCAQIGAKNETKSIRNRVCDADAFWDRLGRGLGGQTPQTRQIFETSFGSLCAPKSEKCNPKIHPKINVK
jgi:hypothetical protein